MERSAAGFKQTVSLRGVCLPDHILKVPEIGMQANRAKSLMDDLKRIVPDMELQMGPLLKVRSHGTHRCCSIISVFKSLIVPPLVACEISAVSAILFALLFARLSTQYISC